MRQKQFWRTA